MRGSTPPWKRAARSLRLLARRGFTILDTVAPWRGDALLPPAHLRIYYYRTWMPDAFARACVGARTELELAGLRRGHRILDIGSGIGNLAIGLIGHVDVTYDGIDVHREAVTWCREHISPRHPAFRFHYADVANTAYNPGAHSSAASYRFPFPDRAFDVIFLSSVFTHLLPDDAANYVAEIGRLLSPGGFCVASYYLLDDERRGAIDAGLSFIPFPVRDPSGVCRLHRADSPEAAVAFDESFIRRIHDEAGLQVRDIRTGNWWRGTSHDQDVMVTVLADEHAPAEECHTVSSDAVASGAR